MTRLPTGLYDPAYDHAACGLGFVAQVDGRGSHEIVQGALQVLTNLAHRGATGSDAETGDGAGIMFQVPDAFLRRECSALGFELPPAGAYAVGTLFLPVDDEERRALEAELERIAAEEGQPILGWRDVPTCPQAIGETARNSMPAIRQVFLTRTISSDSEFTRALYVIRRRLHWTVRTQYPNSSGCYVVSLSATTLVYKGLLQGPQVSAFYPDLRDPLLASALALVHSRFSTNTLGSWPLAHPYRYVAHNGEINALRGNINWMRARERELQSTLFDVDDHHLGPIVQPGGSDSSAFDNTLEFLLLAGRSLPHAIMTMVPEAWENDEAMDPDRRAFYRYTSALMAPWDGPACIAFSDGSLVGATLDRNGLRPARYSVIRDGRVVLASEEGALPVPPEDVIVRSRLGPGRMLVVDTARGRLFGDAEAKRAVVSRKPYRRWLDRGLVSLDALPEGTGEFTPETASRRERQRAFGYSIEDLKLILGPMALHGKEPDGSMGTDTPPAVLSEHPHLLFSYFKQLFAQVTNPPIDPLREEMVMSLALNLGSSSSLLEEGPEHCRRIALDSPILTDDQIHRLQCATFPFRTHTISLLFPPADAGGLGGALARLCEEARAAIEAGSAILVLSDRGTSPEVAAIPSLLATSTLHHFLVREGLRTRASLVIQTGEAREVHHMALLVGYGASAINPYLAFESLRALCDSGHLEGINHHRAEQNYIAALRKGLLKVMSKMGIASLVSYCGAQIFEALGLDGRFIEEHFTGTASRIGGIGLDDVERELLDRHERAFFSVDGRHAYLDVGGEYQLREQGEYHSWNPQSIVPLQRAVRTGSFETFQQFTAHFDDVSSRQATIRSLLEPVRDPIPLDEVETEAEIVRRFSTGAMSFGSISREAHETLALAMNHLGGKSNSGEGGEDPRRFQPDADGSSRRSAIKQIASARFGVTTEYLINADVLQIKMAQGAKPGEGGQLPGHKVSDEIAQVRHSTAGVTLISPPPHHDIYSIEDLAQLIFDLKNVNPRADVSVKLVSEVGVGTVAAGVAKARADHISIAGHDGGTGAAALSSIKHVGLPWELGLAETQQVLVTNNLRGRVRLQADGGLKTGRDVVIGALLGADEFAFSTAPLVAAGCIMMRVCHLNTCPVGIATQDPVLRKQFEGQPEHVINYFFFVAREVRQLMAELGFRRFDDMVGRVDRLKVRENLSGDAASLDLSALLHEVTGGARRQVERQDHNLGDLLDHTLLAQSHPALNERQPVRIGSVESPLPIRNTDRTTGSMLSGEIVRRYGAAGLPEGTIHAYLRGTAGQSFGAWVTHGVTLHLEGEVNDYAGKGLSGGTLVVAPPPNAGYESERSIIAGNVALYGATAGEAYFRGVAGERFAVRNSGAEAVVEGVGDHGCEYMTGGTVVVLGPTGRNFAAGMSGGTAYVLDVWGRFEGNCNVDMVGLEPVIDHDDIAMLRRLVRRHFEWTGSVVAERVLANWNEYLPRFTRVMPHDLRRALERSDTAMNQQAV